MGWEKISAVGFTRSKIMILVPKGHARRRNSSLTAFRPLFLLHKCAEKWVFEAFFPFEVRAFRDLAQPGKKGRGVGGPPRGREVGSHLGKTGVKKSENGAFCLFAPCTAKVSF